MSKQVKNNGNKLVLSEPQCKYAPWLSQAVFLLIGTGYILSALFPLLLILFLVGVYKGIITTYGVSILLGLVAIDILVPIPYGYRPPLKRGGNLWRILQEGGCHYFPARYICLAELSEKKSYILASWPHGLLGAGNHFCIMPLLERGFHPICSGADVLLCIPFLRRLFATIGYCSCSKASLAKVLDVERYGPTYLYNIVHLSVGGIGEMFYRDEQIILSKRKGFIKIALETGADIIPHYTFGANETYWRPFGPSSTLAKISSKLRVSILPWFGRWWIPLGVIAFRVPVLSVMGPVREVPEHKPVTKELVNQLHAKFCDELRKLFDEYKVVYVKEMGASDAWLTKKLRFEDEDE